MSGYGCPWCGKPRATEDDYDRYEGGEGTHLCWADPHCEMEGDEEVVAALRAENKRLAEALREIDARTGHFGEAPPPPEWMPMLSLIAWVGKTARAALAEHRDAKGKEAGR